MERLKVAMICHASNKDLRSHLKLRKFCSWKDVIKYLMRYPNIIYRDYGMWNNITFKEFEKINKIELHAIIPHPGMKFNRQDFEINGVYYHCFRQTKDKKKKYIYNRQSIQEIISELHPDVINVIGIESPFYALVALDINTKRYPLIATMQTGLSDPDFLRMYPMNQKDYRERSLIEQQILEYVQYIATDASWYRSIALRFNPKAQFLRYYFCSSFEVNLNNLKQKEFDFCYFAANIEKAGEDAIYAFAEAHKCNNKITLNLVGAYSIAFYNRLKAIISELGIINNVVISGYFSSHKEALEQVQKSRFALIPIKIDIVSGTIKEAILMGMPVVTFITKGTPALNKEKQCVLLSEVGDYVDMGRNMIKLINEPELGRMLVSNAIEFAQRTWDNEKNSKIQSDMYYAVYNHYYYKTPIPDYITKALY